MRLRVRLRVGSAAGDFAQVEGYDPSEVAGG